MTKYEKIGVLVIIALCVLLIPTAYLVLTGDFPGARLFYGLQEDSPVVDLLLRFRDSILSH